jgi:hypothetical protein
MSVGPASRGVVLVCIRGAQEAVHSAWMARVGICCGGDEKFQLLRYYFTLTLNNASLIVLIIYHEA